ncbi:hypothetical protein [Chryseobacterium sp. SG20098]|uniref:hypothetical protein n=1 Tax=Chryseobacterium sp. SG20098 TaxID=3074145 RepID=UPI00288341C5|nr:hypothetical protein [Chryseobacterium sp. SG20098]WNI39025.1 hypothetical protein RHP76_11115 [Chryseobacterium sp. SG20098]
MSKLLPQVAQTSITFLEKSRTTPNDNILVSGILNVTRNVVLLKDSENGYRIGQMKLLLETYNEELSNGSILDAKSKSIVHDLYDELIGILKSYMPVEG